MSEPSPSLSCRPKMLIAYEPGSTQAELCCSISHRKRVTAKGGQQVNTRGKKKRRKAERRFRDMLDDK